MTDVPKFPFNVSLLIKGPVVRDMGDRIAAMTTAQPMLAPLKLLSQHAGDAQRAWAASLMAAAEGETPEEDRTFATLFRFTVDSEPFVATLTPTPFPYSFAHEGLKPLRRFDPAPAYDQHQWFLTIAPKNPSAKTSYAKTQMTVLHAIAAALCASLDVALVQFGASQRFELPENLIKSAALALAGAQTPVFDWVQFYLMSPDIPSGEASPGCMTLGLTPLIGREFELAPAPRSGREAAALLSGLATLALDHGAVFKDDETVSAEAASELFFVRDAPDGWMRRGDGLAAMLFISEFSMVNPQTLTADAEATAVLAERAAAFRAQRGGA